MTPVDRIAGRAYPLGLANVDTDVIIAAEWLKVVTRHGLGAGAFAALRGDPANVFDDPRFAGAPILIAGDNFGCGSSREHAVWALRDMGLAAVIAPSFADIFAGNALRNGLLTIALPQAAVAALLARAAAGAHVQISLAAQTIAVDDDAPVRFAIDAFRRDRLLAGLDEIAATLGGDADAIAAYEATRPPDRALTPPAGSARTPAAPYRAAGSPASDRPSPACS